MTWSVVRSVACETSALSETMLVTRSIVRLVACETGKARKSYRLISQLGESSIEALEYQMTKRMSKGKIFS